MIAAPFCNFTPLKGLAILAPPLPLMCNTLLARVSSLVTSHDSS
ncbi:Uncharacterised protein [Segatella copri]|nr:Uncharacterised protein [Segatella copri]